MYLNEILSFLNENPSAVLATVDEGTPYFPAAFWVITQMKSLR